MNPKNSEGGQIVIVFAIVLIAILGFTSIAIDIGMIYTDRRYSQSVSDTASLAGAGAAAQFLEKNGVTWTSFSCDDSRVINSFSAAFNAAKTRAANNQITNLDNDLSDNHGIEVTCVNDPDNFEKHIDVHTMVTSSVGTSFIQLFYGGKVRNTVNSVVRIHPRTEVAFGHAIVSLSDQCGTNQGGVVFDGTSDVYIKGGGVFSNSCINASGNVHVDVKQGGIDYVDEITTNGHPTLDPAPEKNPVKMPKQNITPPNCGSGAVKSSTGDGTISPGNYSQIKLTNGELTLQPGLYCLSGDVDIRGGEINGDGVTFYMKQDNGHDTSFNINGGATVHLNAPTSSNLVGGAKIGILIYMAEGNQGSISLLGNAGSSFAGTVYAPNATIDVGGTTGLNPTYNTQLVGNYVKVHGNSKIDINYSNFQPNTDEPKLDVME